tara:strand:+ start:2283 stop:2513 length:231 start_codon:yes stop_codon:yes gene_type:complete
MMSQSFGCFVTNIVKRPSNGKEDMEHCKARFCRQQNIELDYYGHPVCYKHWQLHCLEEAAFDLKKEFHIKKETNDC